MIFNQMGISRMLLTVAAWSLLSVHGESRSLPSGSLVVGYGTDCADTQKMIDGAVKGVNVIIWFASSLVDVNGVPTIAGAQNHTCVAYVAKYLRNKGLQTSHMISIGGWDAPHPNTTWTGQFRRNLNPLCTDSNRVYIHQLLGRC